MNFGRKFARVYPLLGLFVLLSLLAGCTKKTPDDGPEAVVKRFNNIRGMRYCELLVIGGTIWPKNLQAAIMNTTGLNNKANPLDTCPADMWDKIDTEALKKQLDVWSVFKNGPRGWTMDWIELPSGPVRTFEGLQAQWMGIADLPKDVDVAKKGSSAYKLSIINRKSTMTFEKGKPVFILDDPQGTPWVMQASSAIVDPNLTYDKLATLGDRLKPPPGWKYRVVVLDRDLTISALAVGGKAHLTQDEFENSYDECFEANGQPTCSFKP